MPGVRSDQPAKSIWVCPHFPGRTEVLDRFLSCLAGGGCHGKMVVMAGVIREFEGLRVKVDDVIYMPSLDAPPEKPHPFVYFISIHNDSPQPVTIRGRKWVVQEDEGEISVVEGDGIGGSLGAGYA